jgi:hypothetical protein
MKNTLSLIAILLFIGSGSFAQSRMSAWPELKSFHVVMSQTFHPSEEGNLEPIKTRSGELKEKAYALADSKVPAEFNNDKIKAAVAKLKEETTKMDKIVSSKGTDKEITAQLTTVHNAFHEIVGLCSPHDEDHKEPVKGKPEESKK